MSIQLELRAHNAHPGFGKKMAVGAISVALLLAAGCGGGNDSPSKNGGSGGTGGSGGAAGNGGSGGTASGTAHIKFCNSLTGQSMQMAQSVDLSIEIGQPIQRLTASSNFCSSATGVACATVAAGKDVTVSLFYGQIRYFVGLLDVAAGDEIVFISDIDPATGDPTLALLTPSDVEKGATCSSFFPFESTDGGLPSTPDAGAKDGSTLPPKI